MPYKDPKKAKASARRRYLLNIDKIKKRAIDWYHDNKTTVLSQHKENSEQLKQDCKTWRKKNKKKIKSYKKKYEEENKEAHLISKSKRTKSAVARLPDYYVIHQIKKQTGLSVDIIKSHPELIENHREQIKLKRLIKIKKQK